MIRYRESSRSARNDKAFLDPPPPCHFDLLSRGILRRWLGVRSFLSLLFLLLGGGARLRGRVRGASFWLCGGGRSGAWVGECRFLRGGCTRCLAERRGRR